MNVFEIKLQKRVNLYLILFFLVNILLSSCITQRKLEYLHDKDKNEKSFEIVGVEEYTLKPNDNLFIHISSQDDAATNVFTNTSRQTTTNLDPYSASLQSYTIDQNGYLDLPIVGKILVKGKTLNQVSVIIKEAVANILNQPMIYVKLVNRYVTILGEVRSPGHYPVAQEKLSIFEALGFAGDITEYGNRNSVVLLRTVEGKSIRVVLDLTKSKILSSKYFYLSPNDILYVKTSRGKFWGLRPFPFTIVLTAISTYFLYLNYIGK